MKLLYLYTRKKAYPVEFMKTDGHFPLMRALKNAGLVDSVRLVMETGREYHETVEPGVEIETLRGGIDSLKLDRGEVVWIRGAWKSWLPWIERHRYDHWFIYYAANTGHAPWPYWHVILDDETGLNRIENGKRLWFNYHKPIHDIFHVPVSNIEPEYTLCLGASHIYDRKGQYRAFEVMKTYHRLYGIKLRCLMPGKFYSHERHTEAMRAELKDWPNVEMPGFVDRADLRNLLHKCQYFLHLNNTGQGDRGPMEAGCCGCNLILGATKHHHPYTYAPESHTKLMPEMDDYETIARYVHDNVPAARADIAAHFQANSSITGYVVPVFRTLFQIFRENPEPDTHLLRGMTLLREAL